MRPLDSIDDVLALLTDLGGDPYDEEVSQLDHALQTAALAVEADAPDTLIIAALLHDVGHLLDLDAGGSPDEPLSPRHEEVGAAALAGLFGESVTGPIARHVDAKRYLVRVEPDLLDRLSEGSRRSLARQGGAMADGEADRFEQDPWFSSACMLRRWDDAGKVDGLVVPPLDEHVARLHRLVTGSA